MTDTGTLVRIEADGEGHVVEIVLDRPEALNAVSTAMATALADEAVAESLHDVSGFALVPLRPRTLRGVGKVEPFLLTRAGTPVRRPAATPDRQEDR